MSSCSVFGCRNTISNRKEGLTFHRFPAKLHRRDAWLKALNMRDWMPTEASRVCSDHFTKDQFKPDCNIRLRLKDDAVPHVFNYPTRDFKEEELESEISYGNQESRRLRALNDEKFMENFNPDTSVRETRKMNRKIYNQSKKSAALYDSKGVHISTGKDMCDCLDEECPGCYFPCPRCFSQKCGHDCRGNRKWTYEQYDIDGLQESIKNPLLVKR